jgi:hypothetical protein
VSYGLVEWVRIEDRFTPGAVLCSQAVGRDLAEATTAFNAYAPRAAVVMLRRALERACNEKGAKGLKLHEMIADLHKRLGLFDTAHVALATATRHFGNYGAHPNDDLLDDLSDDEARRALDLGIALITKMGR